MVIKKNRSLINRLSATQKHILTNNPLSIFTVANIVSVNRYLEMKTRHKQISVFQNKVKSKFEVLDLFCSTIFRSKKENIKMIFTHYRGEKAKELQYHIGMIHYIDANPSILYI